MIRTCSSGVHILMFFPVWWMRSLEFCFCFYKPTWQREITVSFEINTHPLTLINIYTNICLSSGNVHSDGVIGKAWCISTASCFFSSFTFFIYFLFFLPCFKRQPNKKWQTPLSNTLLYPTFQLNKSIFVEQHWWTAGLCWIWITL